ncbi:MAG: Mrp/NBP35 family ATP-binding protein, partial [candidate division Zixibacteria bacterium]|nr:Mrp/NBP35 family ATP-binding protein [candidate division Zixibacteria bacterium]
SYFTAPDGSRQNIFGEGGGRLLSTKLDQPLFGQIPLETKVREGGDMGQPISSNGDSEAAKMFKEITDKIVEKLNNSN